MGRPDKPHRDVRLRYDADMLARLDQYVELLNQQRLPSERRWTRTAVIENVVDDYVRKELNKMNK